MEIVPATFEPKSLEIEFEFKRVNFIHNYKGYRVTLYCLFDGERIHHFFHQSELLDNAQLAREAGYSVTEFTYSLLVTPDLHPEIFNKIDSYVSRSCHY